MGALAIFLLGNRAWLNGFTWIFYFLGLAGFYLLIHVSFLLKTKTRKDYNKVVGGDFSASEGSTRTVKKEAVRVPLYWLWLASAIVTIIIVAR